MIKDFIGKTLVFNALLSLWQWFDFNPSTGGAHQHKSKFSRWSQRVERRWEQSDR